MSVSASALALILAACSSFKAPDRPEPRTTATTIGALSPRAPISGATLPPPAGVPDPVFTSTVPGDAGYDDFSRGDLDLVTGTGIDLASETAMVATLEPPVGITGPDDFAARIGDRIYFETDSSTLDEAARATLREQAAWLALNTGFSVTIEGHADERGTRDYNLALGERRASAARGYLIALGIDETRLRKLSYGKERPVALGSDEAAWAQNRRAVTVISRDGSSASSAAPAMEFGTLTPYTGDDLGITPLSPDAFDVPAPLFETYSPSPGSLDPLPMPEPGASEGIGQYSVDDLINDPSLIDKL